MRKKNDTFNITIHYLYVWYEDKVIAKVIRQDELTKFLAFLNYSTKQFSSYTLGPT